MTLLAIDSLHVSLGPRGREVPVLVDMALTVAPGEAVGLVGESGSGKSMTLRSVARLLPRGARTSGTVTMDGVDVLGLSGAALRAFRARDIAMVFQDPRAHINPVRTIGDFLTESMTRVAGLTRRAAVHRAVDLMTEVGIDAPEARLRQFPHQLSGGLLQRVMIASALGQEPRLLLADEPTTALDVTTQSDVMAILDDLRRQRGMSMIFVTHDLDLAAAVCDRTAVMYAGRVLEVRPSGALHDDPWHPYAASLSRARPDPARRVPRLPTVPGRPVAAGEAPGGCCFADRCPHAAPECRAAPVTLRALDSGHVRCVRAEHLRGVPGGLGGPGGIGGIGPVTHG